MEKLNFYIYLERLENKMVQNRFKMNVLLVLWMKLIVSEWGYDFNPPILKSLNFALYRRSILALTATATPTVLDIQKQLSFKKENVKRSSCIRKLSYVVLNQDNKDGKLLQILQKLKGPPLFIVIVGGNKKSLSTFKRAFNNGRFYLAV